MIHFFDRADLERYLAEGDPLTDYLGRPEATDLVGERWLSESAAKRMIAWAVYGDLLVLSAGRRIVDVGGGHSSLSYALAERHDYRVVDIAAHDAGFVEPMDWRDADIDCDVLVSVDLFPNVDQGLAAFLARRPPVETRLVLTTYPDRHYRVKRTDADELLTFVAWTWEQTAAVLGIEGMPPDGSLFPNGRQVAMVTL